MWNILFKSYPKIIKRLNLINCSYYNLYQKVIPFFKVLEFSAKYPNDYFLRNILRRISVKKNRKKKKFKHAFRKRKIFYTNFKVSGIINTKIYSETESNLYKSSRLYILKAKDILSTNSSGADTVKKWTSSNFPNFPILSNVYPIFHNVSPIFH